MIQENVAIALYRVVHAACCDDPHMQALQAEIIRLYRAAGEPTPEILSGACPADYQTEPSEFWSETP